MPIDNILSPNLGIQNVLASVDNEAHMPGARQLATTALREAGMEELYNQNVANRLLEDVLSPSVGDGTILQPEFFQSALKDAGANLRKVDDPRVQVAVRDVLQPLLDNTELFKAYTGLMVGG